MVKWSVMDADRHNHNICLNNKRPKVVDFSQSSKILFLLPVLPLPEAPTASPLLRLRRTTRKLDPDGFQVRRGTRPRGLPTASLQ